MFLLYHVSIGLFHCGKKSKRRAAGAPLANILCRSSRFSAPEAAVAVIMDIGASLSLLQMLTVVLGSWSMLRIHDDVSVSGLDMTSLCRVGCVPLALSEGCSIS